MVDRLSEQQPRVAAPADSSADVFGDALRVELRECGCPGPRVLCHGTLATADALHARLAEEGLLAGNEQAPDETSEPVVLVGIAEEPPSKCRGILAEAVKDLTPNCWLVVAGWVVRRPGGPAVPSVSELIGMLNDVTGLAIHAEEVRSIHAPGEIFTRGLVLRLRAL